MSDPGVRRRGDGRARRVIAGTIAWSLTVPALLASGVWMASGGSFRLDLLANLGAQILIVCLAAAAIAAVLRRRRAVVFALLACAIQATPLVRHRAAFLPVAPRARADPGVVRLLHYNDSGLSPKEDVYALLERSGADVASVLVPPVPMQFDVIYGKGLEDRYAGKMVREWRAAADAVSTEVSPGFVVSRWPMERVDCSAAGRMADRLMCAVVRRPEGRFAVIAVHPRSPRNQMRWEEGNQVTLATAAVVRTLRAQGLPVVVLADLNASPTGWRSRALCEGAGLRRAKPLLDAAGTYPDVVPMNIRTGQTTTVAAMWPLSIAIDDALVSHGVEVVGWGAWERLRSEHRPVIVDVRIPAEGAAGTSAANPTDR